MAKKVVKISPPKKKNHPTLFKVPSTSSLGQKAADAITTWAGSWTFILSFLFFVGIWMLINGYFLIKYNVSGAFDPFPFILLNLALSLLAALQAPVILMSQNRQAQKDRLKAEYDYRIDKKSEREIREMKKQLTRIENNFLKKIK